MTDEVPEDIGPFEPEEGAEVGEPDLSADEVDVDDIPDVEPYEESDHDEEAVG